MLTKGGDHGVFEQIYLELYAKYKQFLSDSRFKDPLIKRMVIIDSTTISLFQDIMKNAGRRAANGRRKGGIKVHTAMNAKESVPYLIRFTEAAKTDIPFMKEVNPPAGSIVVMDKGYHNFKQLNNWKLSKVDWVTRLRTNYVYEITEQKLVSQKDMAAGMISDQWIVLGHKVKVEKLKGRLVTYHDCETGRTFQFITSNRRLSPLKIAMLYRQK